MAGTLIKNNPYEQSPEEADIPDEDYFEKEEVEDVEEVNEEEEVDEEDEANEALARLEAVESLALKLQSVLTVLTNENKKLKEEVTQLRKNLPTGKYNLNAFGKENIKFLKKKEIMSVLIKSDKYRIVPNLIRLVHFNKAHLENANLWVNSYSAKYIRIYDGDRFVTTDFEDSVLEVVIHFEEFVGNFLDGIPAETLSSEKKDVIKNKLGSLKDLLLMEDRKGDYRKKYKIAIDNIRYSIVDGKDCVNMAKGV